MADINATRALDNVIRLTEQRNAYAAERDALIQSWRDLATSLSRDAASGNGYAALLLSGVQATLAHHSTEPRLSDEMNESSRHGTTGDRQR